VTQEFIYLRLFFPLHFSFSSEHKFLDLVSMRQVLGFLRKKERKDFLGIV
jgi:hypothetical protein